jgi:hypothetical protein
MSKRDLDQWLDRLGQDADDAADVTELYRVFRQLRDAHGVSCDYGICRQARDLVIQWYELGVGQDHFRDTIQDR